jgi:threonine dehydrogenase-like Zn-dependent dehydrogenase
VRVVVEPLESCRACFACEAGRDSICPDVRIAGVHRPGGFAEWISLPAQRIHRVSETPPPQVMALCEPLAVALHGLDRGGLESGERVLVLGGGTVGLLSGFAARASGASEVAVRARHPGQRRQAERLGLRVFDANEPIRSSGLAGAFDLVVETVGGASDTLIEAAIAARPGGRVVVLGLFDASPPLSSGLSLVKELSYHWSNCYAQPRGAPADFERAARWIEQHHDDLAGLATHAYPLEEIGPAFEKAARKSEDVGRVSILL